MKVEINDITIKIRHILKYLTTNEIILQITEEGMEAKNE